MIILMLMTMAAQVLYNNMFDPITDFLPMSLYVSYIHPAFYMLTFIPAERPKSLPIVLSESVVGRCLPLLLLETLQPVLMVTHRPMRMMSSLTSFLEIVRVQYQSLLER